MRLIFALALFASPALGWEFTPVPVCTIWHRIEAAEMVVTYDPTKDRPYAIAVTLIGAQWPDETPYSIRFDGPQGFTISTARHLLSEDRGTVIAADTGFDNVLNGLEWNLIASPILGDQSVAVPLSGAAPVVQKFRDCTAPGVS